MFLRKSRARSPQGVLHLNWRELFFGVSEIACLSRPTLRLMQKKSPHEDRTA
jgi:hypothetical protein